MKKIVFTLLCLCFICPAIFAQVENTEEEEENEYSILSTDSSYVDIGLIPEVLDENVNDLLQSWHVQYFSQKDSFCLDDTDNVFFSEQVYQMRLARLPFVIPMEYNPKIRECIDLYAVRRRDLVRYMMGMADLYFPIFEQKLDEYDLPLELKYLALVESALNPKALSPVGAAGLWQFMLPTGKIYGLEINSLIDERLDPYKATDAACRYFKEMYAIYGDWYLVMASYNCGPGNVDKAIRRAGGKTNFWDIFPYLPKQTRSYVPLFIAASYIMNYHCEHNLCPIRTSLSMATDTIMVNRMLHLQQVADVLHLDIELLRMLNPQYKREIIPGNRTPSPLKLPVSATYSFIDNDDSIYKHRVEDLLADCTPIDINYSGKITSGTRETIKHTVVPGENLTKIASQYGVTAQNIRHWNGLRSNKVPPGKQLTVQVDNGGIRFSPTTTVKNMTALKNESASAKKGTPTASAKNETAATAPAKQVIQTTPTSIVETVQNQAGDGLKTISYKVQSGDSLYSIAKKYSGVTVAKLQAANNLTSDKLRIGQVLKIPVG
jgi:membrane-bound lytic murein transglycosylase D